MDIAFHFIFIALFARNTERADSLCFRVDPFELSKTSLALAASACTDHVAYGK